MTALGPKSPSIFSTTSNRRETPQGRAELCATVSNGIQIQASGRVLDLSVTGCQIELHTSFIVSPSSMEVRIDVPDLGWSIIVDEAIVQWVEGNLVGLSFVSLRPTEGDRLAWISRGSKEPTRREFM